LLTTYVLPFEAVSILLLAAMVGAIILARREREKD
jgi:NADH:ubiquinone oxidoreductase subunit 6 (subunit J)